MAADRGEEFSAGGVVVRDGEVVVIVPTRRAADGERVLGLPKGHLSAAESAPQAAQRELLEETGIRGELVGELGDVSYSYQRKRKRIPKRVRFYLFAYREGSTEDHDHEVEEARWMPLEQAVEELTYPAEREIVRRAMERSRGAADR
ncbi:MAG: NUDIX hydrolase [Solirubrobacteraceae bacterium]|nr:MAG: NUDIX hydrolase [Solirubrobacterales bacterium]